MDPSALTPQQLWTEIRHGRFSRHTSGACRGYAQANLAILPRSVALDFLIFCQRNPRPCPLLDVLEPGEFTPPCSPGGDIRTDLSAYRVYRDGVLTEQCTDITALWRDDLVTFLLGCSFTFEWALIEAGIPMRHVEEGKNVAMFRTDIECRSAGIFHGNTVVSMRPFAGSLVSRVVEISSRFPLVHGAPIHIGDPAAIGIIDITRPDYGDAVELRPGEIPLFWACGVTPQLVALQSRPPLMITHAPGYMFVTKIPNRALVV